MCTRRVACSIGEERIEPVQGDRVEMEQVAGQDRLACARRNCDQVGPTRRGAGSIPAALRIFHTVEALIWQPSPASSPCTRRYSQVGFSLAKCTIRARTPAGIAGRPGRLQGWSSGGGRGADASTGSWPG